MSHLRRQNGRPRDFIHITPVFLLALLLASQVDSRMFTDFRDIYLLSNPVGARINSFYYKYTLYPAEALKSLDQKLLKTVMIKTNTTRSDLERILLNHDYIPVKNNMAVHLEIVEDDDQFTFKSRGRPILRVSSQAFFTNPVRAIRKFEKKSDIALLLRQMTYISLLTGFPLAIYIIAQGLVSILFGFFISLRTASIIASASCLVVCAILLFSFQSNRGRGVSAQNLMEALSSKRWQDRVAALKIIDEKGLEIDRYESYPQLRTSSHIAERYWLVRNLGHSRSPATYTDLLNFLKDPHPNIVTMALYAIGKRGNRQVIGKIMQIIATSDDWYIQWYAYKALRSIGWRQATSS